jgi:hypothetical protein
MKTLIVPVLPERVAEFLLAHTVPGDRLTAKVCFERFLEWLPGVNERYVWTRNMFYRELRQRGYRVQPRTGNHLTIHGLTLKESE